MDVSRRQFVGFAAAAVGTTAMNAKGASGTWRGWRRGELQVHFIYTGVAESMFVIFPDATTMLLDCGDHAAVTRLDLSVPVLPSPARLAGDWIARYVRRVNPNRDWVDYMVTTHFHQDHVGTPCWQSRRVLSEGEEKTGCWRSGFGLALESLHFRKAVDRGWPDYTDPIPYVDSEWQPLEHMRRVYAYLQKRDGLEIEKFRLGATDQFVPLRDHKAVEGFSVRNICANGRVAYQDGRVRDICAENRVYECKKGCSYLENMMSLGMVFSYGGFRFYTAGDFSGPPEFPEVEKAIGAVAGKVDVAKVNHHGHHSMPFEAVRDLSPRVFVASTWDQLHMTDDTMTRLADRKAYPGDRLICPGVMPAERRRAADGQAWLKDVPPEVYAGVHLVITVPPGGRDYSLTFLDASDESLRVKGERSFATRLG